MAPLERFLGCIYMRRTLQRVIQETEYLTAMPVTEPGVIPFRYVSYVIISSSYIIYMLSLVQVRFAPWPVDSEPSAHAKLATEVDSKQCGIPGAMGHGRAASARALF